MRRGILAGLIALPAVLGAQFPTIAPGTRVRVTASTVTKERVVGTVRSQTSDTLVVTVQLSRVHGRGTEFATTSFAVSAIRSLDVNAGKTASAGARKGFKAGVITGLFVALAETVLLFATGGMEDLNPVALLAALVLVNELFWIPLFTLGGALLGGEAWQQVYSAPPSGR
jgi:hypothetical protein